MADKKTSPIFRFFLFNIFLIGLVASILVPLALVTHDDPYELKGPHTFWDDFLYPQGHKALSAVPVVPLANGLLVPRAIAVGGLLPDNPETLNDIQFSNDLRLGWAVDDEAGLLVSDDGGRTWTRKPILTTDRIPQKKSSNVTVPENRNSSNTARIVERCENK